jgi:hypothetical protein
VLDDLFFILLYKIESIYSVSVSYQLINKKAEIMSEVPKAPNDYILSLVMRNIELNKQLVKETEERITQLEGLIVPFLHVQHMLNEQGKPADPIIDESVTMGANALMEQQDYLRNLEKIRGDLNKMI